MWANEGEEDKKGVIVHAIQSTVVAATDNAFG